MNYSCSFQYLLWCYIFFRHLEIWNIVTSSIPKWPHISVILNDKLKIPQDLNEFSQDLSKDNKKSKIGLKMAEIQHVSRTCHFIIPPNHQKRRKEMSHRKTDIKYEFIRFILYIWRSLFLIWHIFFNFYKKLTLNFLMVTTVIFL